jgi:hypothetical protein
VTNSANPKLRFIIAMSSFQEEDNPLQLPQSLANALKSAAQADMSAEGDSPPPSRPAPQGMNVKRKRQFFKSTENVSKGFHEMQDVMDRVCTNLSGV